MPNSLVASFAKKSKKSVSEVESLWKSAVDIVKKEYKVKESDKKFYPLVVGVLKKSLGIIKPQNIYKQIIEALYEAKSQQDNIQIPKNWKLNSDGTYSITICSSNGGNIAQNYEKIVNGFVQTPKIPRNKLPNTIYHGSVTNVGNRIYSYNSDETQID